MKRMHLQLLKKANCVLASLLMLLGFSCTDDEGEGPIICEYGTPYANFQIKMPFTVIQPLLFYALHRKGMSHI